MYTLCDVFFGRIVCTARYSATKGYVGRTSPRDSGGLGFGGCWGRRVEGYVVWERTTPGVNESGWAILDDGVVVCLCSYHHGYVVLTVEGEKDPFEKRRVTSFLLSNEYSHRWLRVAGCGLRRILLERELILQGATWG
jgi:hypothetical protein